MRSTFATSPLRIAALYVAAFTLLLCVGRSPAAAADTSYLTLVGPQNPSGPCPYNLTFDGSITGQGNSSVTYLWARFVNGKAQDSAPVTATIPSNGTLTLAPQQLSIDASTAGFQSYGLFISSPAGSDTNTHGKVFFKAACVVGGGYIPPIHRTPSFVPIPSNLNFTNDANTCDQFSPPIFCNAALGNGQLAFWWQWQGSNAYPDVDGFKLYDVSPFDPSGSPNSLVAKTSATGQTKFTFGPGVNGHCYAVSAYKGNAESARSGPKCIGNVALSQTQTLTTILSRSSEEEKRNGGGFFKTASPQGLRVGHIYQTIKSIFGDSSLNDAYRTGVFVPLDFLHGHTVYKAVLRMHVNSAWTGGDYKHTATSCTWEIGMGTSQWWTNGDWIDGDFSDAVQTGGEFLATNVGFDITHLVQAIAAGAPNNGFVLKGREENMNAFTEQSCVTGYGNLAIDVTFI